MGKIFAEIDDHLREWIVRQRLFFVATAPLAGDGRVNLSPKGPIGTLQMLGPHTVAYLDLIGSGAETVAHLRENGRIVIMLCAFEGPPRIVRLHGRGSIALAGEGRFDELVAQADFEEPAQTESERAVIVVEVERIADSCGYGVPLMSYEGARPHMGKWAEKKLRVGGSDALLDYQREKNSTSIDGLPAVEIATEGGR